MSNKPKFKFYLVGYAVENLGSRQLPTGRQVLQSLFYEKKTSSTTVATKATVVAKKIFFLWNQAAIPIYPFQYIVKRVLKLHKEWQSVQKSQHKEWSLIKQTREKKFCEKIDELFDIMVPNMKNKLTVTQYAILNGRRGRNRRGRNRRGPNDDVQDKELNEINVENVAAESFHDQSVSNFTEALTVRISDLNIDNYGSDFTQNMELNTTNTSFNRTSDLRSLKGCSFDDGTKRRKMNVMSSELTAALDRTNTSSRNASYILGAFLTGIGMNVADYNISRSSIHESRIKLREEGASGLKTKLTVAKYLVIHWDGKRLPAITGVEKVERLAVIASGIGIEQLLGIPQLISSSGHNQADAVVKIIKEWNVMHRVKALCFDTTSSNVGRLKGAATLIEKQVEQGVLFLACRHHVKEIMLRKVFETSWPVTVGPDVAIFTTFKPEWAKIETSNYKIGLDDPIIAAAINEDKKNEILQFVKQQFEIYQPRNDYRELLELSYIFLGEIPSRGIRFKLPGAAHHARWLAKAIYSLKMFLFREQISLKPKELGGLREICIFVVRFYIKSWFTAPSAIKSPDSDLKLVQYLLAYRSVNAKVAEAALAKVTAHLWYLSEELAPLGFFDKNISDDVKIEMKEAMKSRETRNGNAKRFILKKGYNALKKKNLSYFITQRSRFLFETLDISTEFLEKNPNEWGTDENYKHGLMILRNLRVVNDAAERGVALMQDFNNRLTNDEEQRQFLCQAIQSHRKKYPTPNTKNHDSRKII